MTVEKKSIRIFLAAVILCILWSIITPATASADMGPKPELVIKVINPPEGEYYLDLLIQGEHRYTNLDDRSLYDQTKLSLLENYEEDGWSPAYTLGTSAPMWGDLVGEKTEDGMEHTFGYMGVPDDYKIIIVTPENQIIISEEMHRDTLKSTITYDYSANQAEAEPVQVAYLKQFLTTCLSTLVLEGILLLIFGFSFTKNLVVFLATNVVTQLFMTFTLGVAFAKEGILTAAILFIPIEFIILIAEAVVYSFLLKDRSKARRVAYAITANIVSAVSGFLITMLQFGSY